MPAVTGTLIAQDAFAELNVFLPGEAMAPADGAYALRRLNGLLSEISNQNAFIPVISRNRFTLTANKGGPTNRYTIGIGGDFNIPKPGNQNSITAANLILTVSSPNVRVPLGIYTDQAYDANAIPDMSNSQPTGLYYNPTYQGDLGSIFLWPVPTTSVNDLELFIEQSVAQLADLSTTYYVPDGWPEYLIYNLADRLQGPYGKQLSVSAQRLVISTRASVKASNLSRLSDLLNDASQFATNRQTYYNILSGSGGA